jgi:hypothetical protein
MTAFVAVLLLATVLGHSNVSPRVHSTSAVHDVYVGGKYVGSDPDVRVRRELARDQY